MGAVSPEITFRRAAWCQAVEDHLAMIDGLTASDVAFYKAEHSANRRGLMGVWVDGARVGSLIWATSDEPRGRVFIIEEMGAKARRCDLAGAANKMAHIFAEKVGAKHLRFMTRRPGMLRRMGGEYEISYMLEKAL